MRGKRLDRQEKGIKMASTYLDLTKIVSKNLVSKIKVAAVRKQTVSACMLRRMSYGSALAEF